MRKVAAKWRELGVQLLRSDQTNELDIIAANYPQDVVGRCQRVIEKWWDTNTGATWNQLIAVLKGPSVQLDHFAGKLEQMLTPECKLYSNAPLNIIPHYPPPSSLTCQTLKKSLGQPSLVEAL